VTVDRLLVWATDATRLATAIRRVVEEPHNAELLREQQRLADLVLARVLMVARLASEN
jgi:hypothetical protein